MSVCLSGASPHLASSPSTGQTAAITNLYPCWQQFDARVFVAAFWHLAAKWCIWLDTQAEICQIGLTRQLTGVGTPDDIDIDINININIDTDDEGDVINENHQEPTNLSLSLSRSLYFVATVTLATAFLFPNLAAVSPAAAAVGCPVPR
ncbi:GH11888 [Drosophila grimshawi]|uniref:GH11888 n=1 Tax=Drosophila grimshawi TaxID=7222 RepID=B4JLD9_DROGR|nr:GH11888 [Drosophila grimshawi]